MEPYIHKQCTGTNFIKQNLGLSHSILTKEIKKYYRSFCQKNLEFKQKGYLVVCWFYLRLGIFVTRSSTSIEFLPCRFLDGGGIIGDIIHSHILQTIALLAMEPPISLDGEAIRNEKVNIDFSISFYCWSNVNE